MYAVKHALNTAINLEDRDIQNWSLQTLKDVYAIQKFWVSLLKMI